jgi:hypothetical protein
MAVLNPSYLLKSRHGIWYFQIQIPKKFSSTLKRQLFRKSLKTTNRLQALKKSRLWWLKMEENNFQWEEEAETLNEQYHRGKLIYQKLNKLDSNRAGAENLNKAISENLLPFKVREDIRMEQKNEKKSKKKSLTSI